MPLPTETGSKKYVIAERFFETNVSERLCRLFVSDFKDFQVLSVYSELDNQLVAYKVIQQNNEAPDKWLDDEFLKIVYVDFNADFELLPSKFSVQDGSATEIHNEDFFIHPNPLPGYKHYTQGLQKFNAFNPEVCKVYLFLSDGLLNIIIFNRKECVFTNSFVCKNETEMLYFILNALAISGFTQDEASVFLDYNLAVNIEIKSFLQMYFKSTQNLKPLMEDPDTEIPFLSELLFPNYLLSLCE